MRTRTSAGRCLILALVSIVLVGCGAAKERKAVHLQRGLDMLHSGQIEKARIEFINCLQIDPRDVDARYGLAEVFERKQNFREAVSHYLAVVQLDEKNSKARLKIGGIYLMAGRYDQALQQASEVLRLKPDDIEGLALRGAVRARSGDAVGAEQDADRVLSIDPGNIPGLALKAPLLDRKGEKAEAVTLVEQGLQRHPQDLTLRYVLIELVGKSDVDRVAQVLREIAGLEPKELKHWFALANYLDKHNKVDAAEQVLRDTVNRHAQMVEPRLALVRFLLNRRGTAMGEKTLQEMIVQDPTATELRYELARLYEKSAQWDQAIAVYREVIDRQGVKPDGLVARNRLALVLSTLHRMDEAEALVQEILKENGKDQQALATRGKLALLRGDAQTAISSYRTGLKDAPTSVELLRGLARGHLLNKEPTLAEDAWKQALSVAPTATEAYLDLAKYYVSNGRIDDAVKVVQDALKGIPDNVDLLTALFRLQVAKNDLVGAQATTETLLKKHPNLPAGYEMSGLVRRQQNDLAGSNANFEAALDKAPNAIDPLAQLVSNAIAQGKPEQALERLDQFLRENPRHFVAANMKGEILLSMKQPDRSETAFQKAIDANPRWLVPYRGLASARMLSGNAKGAIETLKVGLAACGMPAVLVTDLAQLYDKLGKTEESIVLYEEMLRLQPESELAANNLAMLLVDHRKEQADLARASAIVGKLDTTREPAYLDTVGWVKYRNGDAAGAITALKSAAAAAPDSGTIHYHLGMVYQAQGDVMHAVEQLKLATQMRKEFPELAASQKALEVLEKQH